MWPESAAVARRHVEQQSTLPTSAAPVSPVSATVPTVGSAEDDLVAVTGENSGLRSASSVVFDAPLVTAFCVRVGITVWLTTYAEALQIPLVAPRGSVRIVLV